VSSILWLHGRDGGNLLASLSEKRRACHLNSSGKVISSFLFCSMYLWAILVALWVLLTSIVVLPIHMFGWLWSSSSSIITLWVSILRSLSSCSCHFSLR